MGTTDIYRVCVTVVDCDGAPVPDADIEIFDVDPVQPDSLLGSTGGTDATGRYCVDLDFHEFGERPFPLGLAEVGGPNLYFHVHTQGGGSLIEDPSAGWAPNREALPNSVLEVTLRVCNTDDGRMTPAFTHVGDFAVGLDFLPDGHTNKSRNNHGGPAYAFHRTLSLRGTLTAMWGVDPVKYRFLWREVIPAVKPAIPITGSLVGLSDIGFRKMPMGNSLVHEIVQVGPVAQNGVLTQGYGWSPLVLTPDAQGWVEIPMGVTVTPSTLLRFVTNHPAVHQGGPSNNPSDVGVTGVLTFEAATVTSNTANLATNSQVIRINNWDPTPELTIEPAPCPPVHGHLKLMYEFDHEYPLKPPAAQSLRVHSYTSPDGHKVKLGQGGLRGWTGSHVVENNPVLSNGSNPLPLWQPCPYIVEFTGRVALTDGYTDAPPYSAPPIAFCKAT